MAEQMGNTRMVHGVNTIEHVMKSVEVYDHAEGGKVLHVSAGDTGIFFHLSVEDAKYLAHLLTDSPCERDCEGCCVS